MKVIIAFLLISVSLAGCAQKQSTFDDYTASVRDFQYELNKEFADKNESPLTPEDLESFSGLDFYPIDSTYRVIAKFEPETNPEIFEMPTTTDRRPLYKTFGTATFELNGQNLKLHIYQNQELIRQAQYENYIFIPFTDMSSGNESYGGGRYIDLEIPKGDTLVIDFNKAYNPYCAYNHKYSCPIPPRENSLPVAIHAGVKAFKH